jgi:hypothetical protein
MGMNQQALAKNSPPNRGKNRAPVVTEEMLLRRRKLLEIETEIDEISDQLESLPQARAALPDLRAEIEELQKASAEAQGAGDQAGVIARRKRKLALNQQILDAMELIFAEPTLRERRKTLRAQMQEIFHEAKVENMITAPAAESRPSA